MGDNTGFSVDCPYGGHLYIQIKALCSNISEDREYTCRPSPVWIIAKNHPFMKHKCFQVAKVIAFPPNYEELLYVNGVARSSKT